jgi:hypothetical protein
MIPAEVLERWNVAARDQSREYFNSIGGFQTFRIFLDCMRRSAPNAAVAWTEAWMARGRRVIGVGGTDTGLTGACMNSITEENWPSNAGPCNPPYRKPAIAS